MVINFLLAKFFLAKFFWQKFFGKFFWAKFHFCKKSIFVKKNFCAKFFLLNFLSWKHFLAVNFFWQFFLFRIFCCCYFFLVEHFCQQNCCCGIFVKVRICSRWSQEPTFKVWSKLGLWQLRYSWYGQMSQGQMLPKQMSFWKLEYVQIGPRNLPLKFGQNRTSNSWDIAKLNPNPTTTQHNLT